MLPISVRGVSRRFGGTLALDRIDLEVCAGEFVALVGPSGCGKTTLLRIVADLESPTNGEVWIGPQTAGAARGQRLLGLVSQRPAVLPRKRAIDDVVFTQRIARLRPALHRVVLRRPRCGAAPRLAECRAGPRVIALGRRP